MSSLVYTQVVGSPQIVVLKSQTIPEVETASEYFPINDEIPVDLVHPKATVANVNEIYKREVLDKAVVTPLPVAPKKSKLPLIAGAIAAYFMFKG